MFLCTWSGRKCYIINLPVPAKFTYSDLPRARSFGVLTSVVAIDSFFSRPIQTGPRAHCVPSKIGTDSLSRWYRGRGVTGISHSMDSAIHLLFMAPVAFYGATFTFANLNRSPTILFFNLMTEHSCTQNSQGLSI
jgi:hypothetical protein